MNRVVGRLRLALGAPAAHWQQLTGGRRIGTRYYVIGGSTAEIGVLATLSRLAAGCWPHPHTPIQYTAVTFAFVTRREKTRQLTNFSNERLSQVLGLLLLAFYHCLRTSPINCLGQSPSCPRKCIRSRTRSRVTNATLLQNE